MIAGQEEERSRNDRADATRSSRLALVALCLAQFGVVLAFQGTAVVLPEVERAFEVPVATTQWLVSVNALAFGGLLLPAGRAADLFGHRRLFMAGTALFAMASLAAGLAPTVGWLIAARGLQGAGTAMSAPATFALLADIFPEGERRRRALSAWGVAGPLGGIGAVLLGGALGAVMGWRAVFLVGAPVSIPVLMLAMKVLPVGRKRADCRLDVTSAVTGAAGAGLLVFGLGGLSQTGHITMTSASSILVGAICLSIFVRAERRAGSPLIPPALLGRPGMVRPIAVAFFQGASTNTPIVFYALYMQQFRDASPWDTGVGFLPCNVALMLGSMAAAPLVGRAGFRATMAAGMAMVVAGLALHATVSPGGSYVLTLLPGLSLLGFGLGVSQVAMFGAAAAAAQADERGVAGGLVSTAGQIGTAVGLALLVAVSSRVPDDIVSIRIAFAGAGVLALGGVASAIVGGRWKSRAVRREQSRKSAPSLRGLR